MVKHFGSSPKGQDYKYKKMSFGPGMAGLILGDRGDELRQRAQSGAALPLQTSSSWASPWGGVSGTSIWEETPGQNLGQPSEIIVLGWPGSTLGQPRRSWWKWLGRWVSEPHGWGCWPHHPAYRLRAWKANISKPNSFTDTFMQGFDCIIDALLLYFIIFVFFTKILTYKVH